MKKIALLVKKFSSGFVQQECALREKSFEEKWFLFRKSFIFLLSFLEFEWFLCPSCKILQSGVSNRQTTCGKKKIVEISLEKFCPLNDFGLWGEKIWTFCKTVRHDSQNRSLTVQMTNLSNFSGSKNNCLNVFGDWTETSDFWRKLFSGLAKPHFTCPVQNFGKKMIKVNSTFCRLFRTLCVNFCSGRKVIQGRQNHKLSVQRKILGRLFLMQWFLQNNFRFWAENLGVLAKSYRLCGQKYISCVRRNIFEATVYNEVFKYLDFFGVLVKFSGQNRKFFFRVDKLVKIVSRNKLRKKLFQ